MVPTFLSAGTSFIEDNFSMDGREGEDGFGMIQAHYIQAHLLLCVSVPNSPGLVPVQGPEVGDHWSKGNPCTLLVRT